MIEIWILKVRGTTRLEYGKGGESGWFESLGVLEKSDPVGISPTWDLVLEVGPSDAASAQSALKLSLACGVRVSAKVLPENWMTATVVKEDSKSRPRYIKSRWVWSPDKYDGEIGRRDWLSMVLQRYVAGVTHGESWPPTSEVHAGRGEEGHKCMDWWERACQSFGT